VLDVTPQRKGQCIVSGLARAAGISEAPASAALQDKTAGRAELPRYSKGGQRSLASQASAAIRVPAGQ